MAEINNNIPNFGINNKKVDNRQKETQISQQSMKQEETSESNYVQDTGVLGRSQVVCSKCGGNITQSVDDAIYLALNNPELLFAAEDLIDEISENYDIPYEECLAAQDILKEMVVAQTR